MKEPHALSRTTDPTTSREAATQVEATGTARSARAQILALVKRTPDLTAAEIAARLSLERHVPSRRLPELRDAGLVETGPARLCKVQGTMSMTWRLVAQPDLFKPIR